jgi:hypothetical protein
MARLAPIGSLGCRCCSARRGFDRSCNPRRFRRPLQAAATQPRSAPVDVDAVAQRRRPMRSAGDSVRTNARTGGPAWLSVLHAPRGRVRRGEEARARLLLRSRARREPRSVAEPRLGRRTALTFPLLPPPQKNKSPPSDSSPETPTPAGISSLSKTSPVPGSTRRKSLSSPSQVPCHSSPSTQVTPVTKRLDSIVRRIVPVWGSI